MRKKTIYEWAEEYCGDPKSHLSRGVMIKDFLVELGMTPESRVLDVGCGALSQGAALILYLNSGKYVGLDPNGWLIEAALNENKTLLTKEPRFSYAVDFNVENYGGFDFIVAHSVFSHVAHWQLGTAFHNLRKVVNPGATMLASIRLDQYNSYHEEWQYPGNSFFRFNTIQAMAYQDGWHIEREKELRARLMHVAPNDMHDWIRCVASPTPTEINDQRLDDEDREREFREIKRLAKLEYERREEGRLVELELRYAKAQLDV